MHRTTILVTVLTLLVLAGRIAAALEIRAKSDAGSYPAGFSYQQGSEIPFEVVLEIAGSTPGEPPIALWQLGLSISPAPGSQGTIQLESIFAPEDALFGSEQALFAYNELPASSATISAVDTSEDSPGVPIPPGEAVSIVILRFLLSEDASGEFVLATSGYDEDQFDTMSRWETGGVNVELFPFDNAAVGNSLTTLAILDILSPSQSTGDFNNDLAVDAADYTLWRDGLGAEYGEVHYDLWKSTFGTTLMAGQAGVVPEPSIGSAICGGLFLHLAFLRLKLGRN